jgi:hypothetical protein
MRSTTFTSRLPLTIIIALIVAACSGDGPSTAGGAFEPDPCATVETWCGAENTHTWTSDTGDELCACMCDAHEDCTESPTESHCGVLIRARENPAPGENAFESVFEGGYPRVCRTPDGTSVP